MVSYIKSISYIKSPIVALSNIGASKTFVFQPPLLRGAARICVKGGTTFSNYRLEKTWAFNKPPKVGISASCCRYSRHYLVLQQQKRDLSAHYVVLTGFYVLGRCQTCDHKRQEGNLENILILRSICVNLIILNQFLNKCF